jgi:hypothetical protein
MNDVLVVLINCPDDDVADRIARTVVEQGWPPASTGWLPSHRSIGGKARSKGPPKRHC